MKILVPALFPALLAAQSALTLSIDDESIGYHTRPLSDPVTLLQQRLDKGEASLKHEDGRGYLRPLLKLLGIPESSQVLVFSKTSFQQHLISPETPRALYFNDNVYVGYVQGGDVLEISSVDPLQGAIFYTLDQRPKDKPRFARRDECLQCHASPKTLSVPGHLVRSVFPDSSGFPQIQAGSFDVDHATPLKERWGGWYVTGSHGSQRHMGNVLVKDKDAPEKLDVEAGANVQKLDKYFDTSAYLTPHSDIVALMVLEHQVKMHNLITRVNYETRMALAQQAVMNQILKRPADEWSESTRRRIERTSEALVSYMLFTDEAVLTGKVKGTSGFAEEFARAGRRDTKGRSLHDFDLERRLFRYPCSYLIESEAFRNLPKPALDYILMRLEKLLGSADRAAIREILAQL
jgi:hypothetical protein